MTILAAVGGGPRDAELLRVAGELASAFDEPLHVLHVMTDDEFQSRNRNRSEYYHDDAVEEAATFARECAEAALDVDDLRMDADVHAEGQVGEPAVMILEAAGQHDARYVVVGGRKRTPVGKALFGSVTQSVLLDADRPVVTVTGDGEGGYGE